MLIGGVVLTVVLISIVVSLVYKFRRRQTKKRGDPLRLEEEQEYSMTTLKIVVVGDSGVGKTSLTCRFVNDTFDPESAATVCVDFKTTSITLDSGNRVTLAIWVRTIARSNSAGEIHTAYFVTVGRFAETQLLFHCSQELKETNEHFTFRSLLGRRGIEPSAPVSTEGPTVSFWVCGVE